MLIALNTRQVLDILDFTDVKISHFNHFISTNALVFVLNCVIHKHIYFQVKQEFNI